eukprot:13783791-Ditylum_brightwellii.AAC.1
MGAVDKGNQHRALGAAFCNITHFKKWYKKGYFGIADFSMLKSFSACNLSVDELAALWCGGVVQSKRLIKWEIYSIACEEVMTFVSPDEATTASVVHTSTLSDTSHVPTHASLTGKKVPLCMICSMEESVLWCACKENTSGRKYARRTNTSLYAVHQIAKSLYILSIHLDQC